MGVISHLILADFCARRHILLGGHQRQLAFCILCTENHALRQDTCQLRRFQVCHNHNSLTYHLLRRIRMFDSADNLTYLASDLNLGAEKLLGLRNSLAGEDHANLELQFCKIIVGDLCLWL